MSKPLTKQNTLLFDYTKYVDPLREELRLNAENLAVTNNLTIEFIRSSDARKEDIAKKNYDPNKHWISC